VKATGRHWEPPFLTYDPALIQLKLVYKKKKRSCLKAPNRTKTYCSTVLHRLAYLLTNLDRSGDIEGFKLVFIHQQNKNEIGILKLHQL
jgi:hypothetical protein